MATAENLIIKMQASTWRYRLWIRWRQLLRILGGPMPSDRLLSRRAEQLCRFYEVRGNGRLVRIDADIPPGALRDG